MNGTTLEPSEGGRALRWRDGTWSDLCERVCVCFCLCIVQQWDMPARVPAACQLLGAAYSLWATCVITCCLCWELNASLNVCACVHPFIHRRLHACVRARVCVCKALSICFQECVPLRLEGSRVVYSMSHSLQTLWHNWLSILGHMIMT